MFLNLVVFADVQCFCGHRRSSVLCGQIETIEGTLQFEAFQPRSAHSGREFNWSNPMTFEAIYVLEKI